MKKSLMWIVGIAVILIVIIGFYISNQNNGGNTVKIGAVMPLTGFAGYWGQYAIKGMDLAVEDIKSDYGNESVTLLVEDDQSDNNQAVTIANKFVSVDQVDVLYSEFSGLSAAVSPIALSNNITLMYGAFNQKIISSNPLSIKSFIDYSKACKQYAEYAKANGVKKIAVVNELEDVVPYCIEEIKKEYSEDNIVLFENVVDNKDYRTLLLKIKAQNVDSILILMVEASSTNFIKQKAELGINAPLVCYRANCYTQKIIETFGDTILNNTIIYDVSVSDVFKEKFKEKYDLSGEDEIIPAAFAYNGLLSLFESARLCEDSKDAKCIVNNIDSVKVKSSSFNNASFENRRLQIYLDFYKINNGNRIKIN